MKTEESEGGSGKDGLEAEETRGWKIRAAATESNQLPRFGGGGGSRLLRQCTQRLTEGGSL